MVPVLIKDLLTSSPDGRMVTVCGWVRTMRDSKNLVFVQVNDGSCFANIQLTFDRNAPAEGANLEAINSELAKINTGASVKATGLIIPSPASGQAVEVTLVTLEVLGTCNPDEYPLQKNKMRNISVKTHISVQEQIHSVQFTGSATRWHLQFTVSSRKEDSSISTLRKSLALTVKVQAKCSR